jgi:hypothetical protein
MGIEKLLDNLKDYLDKGTKKKHAHCDRIDDLLLKLSEKEKKLQKKIAKEKNPTKRKQMKTDLKVIAVQYKKGMARREELQGKCK